MRAPSWGAGAAVIFACLVARLSVVAEAILVRSRGHATKSQWPIWKSLTRTVCDDYPKGWDDTAGRTCEDYVSKKLCTKEGEYGENWEMHWGPFSLYGQKGQTALGACCGCGGGYVQVPPTCSYMECPPGFEQKMQSWLLHCKDLKCTIEDDLATCCVTHPGVQKVVYEVTNETEKLKKEVLAKVKENGTAVYHEVRDRLLKTSGDLGHGFVAETAPLQDKAVKEAQAEFAVRTAHATTLQDAASYQIITSGFIAARDAKVGHVNTAALQAQVREASSRFSEAAQAWADTEGLGDTVLRHGEQEWKQYYRDLNQTWPEIVHGIDSVNAAIQDAVVPRQGVRWSEQSVRLASDYAQIVNGQIGGIDGQVGVAEDRSEVALEATLANKDRIGNLKEMVDKLEKSLVH